MDDTLLVAPGEEDDDEFDSRNAESSEGEDWDDGNTLVTKFMEFDPECVLWSLHLSISYSDATRRD